MTTIHLDSSMSLDGSIAGPDRKSTSHGETTPGCPPTN
jgi:hypothetical protein